MDMEWTNTNEAMSQYDGIRLFTEEMAMGTAIVTKTVYADIQLDESALLLGNKTIHQLKIPINQPLTVRFGSYRHTVTVASLPYSDHFAASDSLIARLGLHFAGPLGLRYNTGLKQIHIGPLIGVLVRRMNPASQEEPFGAITSFCKELTDACKQLGACVYFFTVNEMTSSASHLDGWHYTSAGWRKNRFPIPDVVYNRLTSRVLEDKPSVQHFFREIKLRHGAKVFNEKYLNKNEVFQALRGDPKTSALLPESHMLDNAATLKMMCTKYPVVFLKPIMGSLGRGIIRISHVNDPLGGRFICDMATMYGTQKVTYNGFLRLNASISEKMKQRRYQIQQGLQLIRVGGRPVDFRALVQRDHLGAWRITSIVARIAGSNHFVSNLARGGTLCKVKDAVSRSSIPSMAKDAPLRIRRAALAVARGIETNINAHFGELGVDLAMDTSGRVWLLEVNSKPSKHNKSPLTEDKTRPSVRYIVYYSRYLAGF